MNREAYDKALAKHKEATVRLATARAAKDTSAIATAQADVATAENDAVVASRPTDELGTLQRANNGCWTRNAFDPAILDDLIERKLVRECRRKHKRGKYETSTDGAIRMLRLEDEARKGRA